jgi:hypothetical protein
MIGRIAMLVSLAALAGCGSNATPSVDGKDALGLPIYTLSGESLSQIELTANSSCPGGTRPYYRDFTAGSVSYTCE